MTTWLARATATVALLLAVPSFAQAQTAVSSGGGLSSKSAEASLPPSTVPGAKAALTPKGKAIPPAAAPAAVKAVIAAGNKIAHKPYKWGGGHARLFDSGYDCSGSVSYALRRAGLRFDTSAHGIGGSRWTTAKRSPRGFVARYPVGF